MKTKITFKGTELTREVELIGDIEKVRYYSIQARLERDSKGDEFIGYYETEVYNQDELDEIEAFFMGRLMELLSPILPII